MADVLRAAKPLRKAKYLCMEGADELVSCLSIRCKHVGGIHG